jgi:hypothetical protein
VSLISNQSITFSSNALDPVTVDRPAQMLFCYRQSQSRRLIAIRARQNRKAVVTGSSCIIEDMPELIR